MNTLFLVFRDHGPSWVTGTPTRQQPLWDKHAAFMDRMFDEGKVVLAGPFADGSRALVIIRARDQQNAAELFRDDPWETAGVMTTPEPIEWTIFLDSRERG